VSLSVEMAPKKSTKQIELNTWVTVTEYQSTGSRGATKLTSATPALVSSIAADGKSVCVIYPNHLVLRMGFPGSPLHRKPDVPVHRVRPVMAKDAASLNTVKLLLTDAVRQLALDAAKKRTLVPDICDLLPEVVIQRWVGNFKTELRACRDVSTTTDTIPAEADAAPPGDVHASTTGEAATAAAAAAAAAADKNAEAESEGVRETVVTNETDLTAAQCDAVERISGRDQGSPLRADAADAQKRVSQSGSVEPMLCETAPELLSSAQSADEGTAVPGLVPQAASTPHRLSNRPRASAFDDDSRDSVEKEPMCKTTKHRVSSRSRSAKRSSTSAVSQDVRSAAPVTKQAVRSGEPRQTAAQRRNLQQKSNEIKFLIVRATSAAFGRRNEMPRAELVSALQPISKELDCGSISADALLDQLERWNKILIVDDLVLRFD